MLEIKIYLVVIVLGCIVQFFNMCTRKREVIKNRGESRTRVMDAEKVAAIKRKAMLLMERGTKEEQRKGAYLRSFLEELNLWEEKVRYKVSVFKGKKVNRLDKGSMDTRTRLYLDDLANKRAQPIYYCADTLLIVSCAGTIVELETGFLKTQYSPKVKDRVLIDYGEMSIALPCEEKISIN